MTNNQIDNYNALQKQDTKNRKLIKKLQLDKQALKEQFSLYGVVSSFLDKEAESLGVKKEDLYINVCENEMSVMKEVDDDFYMFLETVKVIKK